MKKSLIKINTKIIAVILLLLILIPFSIMLAGCGEKADEVYSNNDYKAFYKSGTTPNPEEWILEQNVEGGVIYSYKEENSQTVSNSLVIRENKTATFISKTISKTTSENKETITSTIETKIEYNWEKYKNGYILGKRIDEDTVYYYYAEIVDKKLNFYFNEEVGKEINFYTSLESAKRAIDEYEASEKSYLIYFGFNMKI